MCPGRRIRIAATFFALAAVGEAIAQSENPAARGATTTLRVAAQNRLPPAVSERAVTAASPFSEPCGDRAGTVSIGAEVEPHVAINPLNPNHLVGAWQQDRYSNGGARGQGYGASFDGGLTWTRGALPVTTCTGGEYARATDPWVTFAPDGTVHQITLAFTGESSAPGSVNAMMASRSLDGGITWSVPITIARDTDTLFNDKETITADPLDARFVYAVWDRLLGGNISATIFSRSTDAGVTWEPSRALYTPPQGGGTIGNLIRVLPNGTLVNVFMQLSGPPAIYVMRSTDRGVTWSAPNRVIAAGALGAVDPETGDFIRDGSIIPEMAVGPDGTLHLVWQDARFTQVRDAIAYSRSTDAGLTWSAPVRVNAEPGVVAFTPQVHVRADGMIGVTYYDLRSNTADPATLLTDYWLARSVDGVSWAETRVSAPFDISTAPFAGGWFVGDYTGLVSAGTTFIAFYAKTTGIASNATDVFAARIEQATGALDAKAYRAAPMPQEDLGTRFWDAVSANAARALERRYLKVQR
ncbi:MAG: exo-alpha-sialidase [Burkholderiales bacterium]|nr:exo-alpha-sialidase [Burkholderiales bacterium]